MRRSPDKVHKDFYVNFGSLMMMEVEVVADHEVQVLYVLALLLE